VLVEVVDKILSLFSGAISKQSLCRINLPLAARFQLASNASMTHPPCAPLSDTNREFPDVHRWGNFVDDVPNSVMPIPKQVIGEASGWWLTTLSGHRCLGNMP